MLPPKDIYVIKKLTAVKKLRRDKYYMSRCFSKLITKNIRFLKDREYPGYLKRWNVKVSPHTAAMMHSGILGDETPLVDSSQEMYDSHFHGLHDFCILIGDYNSLIILDPSVKKECNIDGCSIHQIIYEI